LYNTTKPTNTMKMLAQKMNSEFCFILKGILIDYNFGDWN